MRHVLRLSALAAAVFTMMPAGAMAADLGGMGSFGMHPYIGLGVGIYDLKFSGAGYNRSNNVFGGMLRLGVDFNKYLGVELRAGATDLGKTPNSLGYTRQYSSYLFSYLAKIQLPVTQELRIYGLAGATTGKVNFFQQYTTTGVRTNYAGKVATGPSFGGGIDYSVDDSMRVGVEYMRYWNKVSVNKATSPAAKENASSYLATLRIMM